MVACLPASLMASISTAAARRPAGGRPCLASSASQWIRTLRVEVASQCARCLSIIPDVPRAATTVPSCLLASARASARPSATWGGAKDSGRCGAPRMTTAPWSLPMVRFSRPPSWVGRSRAGLPWSLMWIICTAVGSGVPGQAASHASGGAARATMVPTPVCFPVAGTQRIAAGRGSSGLHSFRLANHLRAGWSGDMGICSDNAHSFWTKSRRRSFVLQLFRRRLL